MRYYNPNLGRFIFKDLKIKRNRYVMALNNPIKYNDPFGLSCTEQENCDTCDPERLRDCHESCYACCDRHNNTRNSWLTVGGIIVGTVAGFISKNPWVTGLISAGYSWLASTVSTNAYEDCKQECDEYYTGNNPKACTSGVTTPPDKNCPEGQEHCEDQEY